MSNQNQNNAEFFEQAWANMDEDEKDIIAWIRGWRGSEDSWSWKESVGRYDGNKRKLEGVNILFQLKGLRKCDFEILFWMRYSNMNCTIIRCRLAWERKLCFHYGKDPLSRTAVSCNR